VNGGAPAPVFVGGTGRSGTTIVARLIAAHPAYALVPIELRFHAELSGLPGLLTGRVDPALVTELLRTHWAHRLGQDGRPRGVTELLAPEAYEAAIERFERGRERDPVAASRDLVETVAAACLPEGDLTVGWVEMTPPNVEAAGAIATMFPEARFVHAIRSGLDVACSMQRHAWAPDDLGDCLLWWEDRFARAGAGARALPEGSLHEVRLEELSDPRTRDRVVRELLAFLGLHETKEVREFRSGSIRDGPALTPRWARLPAGPRSELGALYRQALRRLRLRGARSLPVDADAPPAAAGVSVRARGWWRWLGWRARRSRFWNRRPSRRRRLVRRIRAYVRGPEGRATGGDGGAAR
jgi:hypothetical protein